MATVPQRHRRTDRQTDRQWDERTIYDSNTEHRAVKIGES